MSDGGCLEGIPLIGYTMDGFPIHYWLENNFPPADLPSQAAVPQATERRVSHYQALARRSFFTVIEGGKQ